MTSTEKNILSVTQLNRQVKRLLEQQLPRVWIMGEISNLAKPASGHWYFSLKDQQAQIRCAMFRNANQRLRWQPEAGQQVIARAQVTLYEGRGDYQLIVDHLELAGAGQLQQQYEVLKNKLQAEGLFATERKKALPTFPEHIGIITSPTGAAIHDILTVLNRRYPAAQVTIFPVSVQGESAAPEMISALLKAQQWGQADVLIIGRGGGSIEDLWAFNDEALAREIANCSIPIVSAVGHEVDFTIADFVADQRAPTPSASAEIVSPDSREWLQTLDYYMQQFLLHTQKCLSDKRQQVSLLQQRLRHPGETINHQKQSLNHLKARLLLSIKYSLEQQRYQLTSLLERKQKLSPQDLLDSKTDELEELQLRLILAIREAIEKKQTVMNQTAALLNAMSPQIGRAHV